MQPGTRLGPYEIIGILGAGGMGEVYRAKDTRLDRQVALKVLPAEFASNAERRQRFEKEAKAIAALNHPNIVAVFDVGENYFVAELVDGASLRGAELSPRDCIDVAAQIADGLAAAHAAGITHRDIKPDNILLTRDGRVKILDFGLAKTKQTLKPSDATLTLAASTDPGMVMGTVGYMSPEQVRGEDVDARSDIFSFGAVLYELIARKRAFTGQSAAEAMTAIAREDPAELGAEVPAGLRQIVAHCLEKNRDKRFQNARDLAFALRALSGGSGASKRVEAPTRRSFAGWIADAPVIRGLDRRRRGGSGGRRWVLRRGAKEGRGASSSAADVPASRNMPMSRAHWAAITGT